MEEEADRDLDSSPERVKELLPQVLPILVDCLNIPLGIILSLRMINRDSNLAIIHMLEEESYNFYEKQYEKNSQQRFNEPPRNVPNRTHLAKKVIEKYTFKDGESVQKFISHFGPISSSPLLSQKRMTNPFLSRSLFITTECSGEEDPKVVNPCRVLMLETFGHQIRNVTFHITGTLLGDSLIHFRALLPHLPNLKCLKIVGCSEDWVESEEFIRVVVRLPKLDQLELLDVQNFKEEFSGFMSKSKFTLNELLVEYYGPQLKILICGEALFKRENVGKLLHSSLQNLRIFRLNSVTHSSTLLTLSEVDWPALEELELGGGEEGGGNYDPFSDTVFGKDFIRTLNTFSSSLVHLKLHGVKLANETNVWNSSQDDRDNDDDQIVIKPMPKLTSLTTELSNLNIGWFWNPIRLNCHQLEEVRVQTFSVSKDGLAQLQGEFDKLPKLRKIEIYCVYSEGGNRPKKIVLTRKVSILV
ncbi:unnamed protein product [Orchesella dallaii]|uniref:Uncharacterized protein n=1 Tax=Orchesella dallaii TaxID=48710 RepID=A0ABP1S8V0_9HEXA